MGCPSIRPRAASKRRSSDHDAAGALRPVSLSTHAKSCSRANTWQDHLKWRKRVKPDELPLITEVPEVLEKFKPGGQCGIDKEGSPVFYERTGMSYVRRSVLLSRTCRARARACVESRRVRRPNQGLSWRDAVCDGGGDRQFRGARAGNVPPQMPSAGRGPSPQLSRLALRSGTPRDAEGARFAGRNSESG